MARLNSFIVAFGELETSSLTIGFMISMAVFIFAAVGLSSYNLIQAAVDKKDENNMG